MNKIDRLIVDKWMDAREIHIHLTQIIEQINGFVSQLIYKDFLENEKELELEQGKDGVKRVEMT